jgi:UDP-N-acetylmuramate--alanine ligase
MVKPEDIQSVFFLGIGGIGMSALARYFHIRGYRVAGYDRTPSPLTQELEHEGIAITYEDDVEWFERLLLPQKHTLVVRTPAVPEETALCIHLRAKNYAMLKRAEVLGFITKQMRSLCVAGTHGKTTTSTMLAHLIYQSEVGTNAFLGGISLNYGTNVLLQKESPYVVVEADEYDRSFHHLSPCMSIITAVDPDHLDIYGTEEAYREAFEHYTSLISEVLVVKQGIALSPRMRKGAKVYTYGVVEQEAQTPLPHFYADNIRVQQGKIYFDFHTPNGVIPDILLGVPMYVNIENAVAAMAVAWLNGVTDKELRRGMGSFKGVKRRFNIHIQTPRLVYIDDYAHHPQEIATAIEAVRKIYSDYTLVGVFQPHLYTRTRDFADEFAQTLSTLDEVVLLPIYPAREEPIEGVNSEMLLDRISNQNKHLVPKEQLVSWVANRIKQSEQPIAVLTLGAGDIDRLVKDIKNLKNG